MYDEEISEEIKKEYFETNLKAAEIGFVESMCTVAGLYLSGFGVEKNFDEAIKWYEKAVGEGDISALIALGEIYIEKDVEKAIFYLSKAAENNNVEAIKKLAGVYEAQNNLEKRFEWCLRGASLGNDNFMREVANCYLNGRGVPQDDLKALEWYIKVFEISWIGDINDIRMVEKIYNKHFKFSEEKFLGYYVTTEKLGHFNAIFGIAAELYKTDKYRAFKWYKLAGNMGDLDAALAVYHIGRKDFDGSTPADISSKYYQTFKWYEKAAEFGNINAAKNLVMMHTDKNKSLYWLNKVLEMKDRHKND